MACRVSADAVRQILTLKEHSKRFETKIVVFFCVPEVHFQ